MPRHRAVHTRIPGPDTPIDSTTRFLAAALFLALSACAPNGVPPEPPEASDYLFVWATDGDSVDLNFLSVVDANRGSATYADIVTTLPVPTEGRTRGHHTEHRMPEGGLLFANDFGTGMSYVLDLLDPRAPLVADSFVTAGPLRSPHSFERLPSGNVLATFQNEGPGNEAPGGIAELDPHGDVVQWSHGRDGGPTVRPYSLAVVPELDRVVTGSVDMRGEVDSRAVQIWRLSDLALLQTLTFPAEWGAAAEPRVLSDGKTVLVSTFGCKLLRVSDLTGDLVRLTLAFDFGGSACALPVVAGPFWIQTVPDVHGLVAVDTSDPDTLTEVSRVTLAGDDWPHWIALSPDQRRIVITGYAGTRHRVLLVDLDPATGTMQVDSAFTDDGAGRPGISFDRDSWPHGTSGPADPHGAVFSLPNTGS